MKLTLVLLAVSLLTLDRLLGLPDGGLALNSAISYIECTLLPLYTDETCLQDRPPVNVADLQAVPIEE